MAQALRIPESFPTPCRVCGCRQVQIDAVEGSHPEAPLLLAECPRCDHRWTDAWTDEGIEGGRWITADAPLDRIPLFLRGDARLPIRGKA